MYNYKGVSFDHLNLSVGKQLLLFRLYINQKTIFHTNTIGY